MNNNRFRTMCAIAVIIGLLALILAISSCCTSHGAQPDEAELPAFTAVRPERPELQPVEDDAEIPRTVLLNQLLLTNYATKLEIYCDAWEDYWVALSAM